MKNWSMKKKFVLVAVAVCAVAVIRVLGQPLVSEAEKLTPIITGVNGTLHPTAGRLIIQDETDYSNFFGGNPPATPVINFATQDVLAVTQGTSPQGSRISITGVDVRTTSFTAGWGFVHVDVTIGSGSATVQPYAVVTVAKGALAYAFVDGGPIRPFSGPTPFQQIHYATGGGDAPYLEYITIDGSGSVTVNRTTGSNGGTNYVGSLSPLELAHLSTVFADANPSSLPAVITDPESSPLTNLPFESLNGILAGTPPTTFATTVQRAGFYDGSIEVMRLVNALRGPAERVVRATQGSNLAGRVSLSGTQLSVGVNDIAANDPFYPLIGSAVGEKVEIQALGGGSATGGTRRRRYNDRLRVAAGFPEFRQYRD